MNEMTAPKAVKVAPDASAKSAPAVGREYAEFLPAAMEIAAAPPPRIVPILILTIIGAVAAALLWSCFSWLDVYTNAAGRVRSTVPSTAVQPLETGRVKAIFVENGKHVTAGDVLLQLDEVAVSSALDAAISGRASWVGEVVRRRAAYQSVAARKLTLPTIVFPPDIPEAVVQRETESLQSDLNSLFSTLSAKRSEEQEAQARLNRFTEVKAVKARLLDILSERVDMQETLKKSGAGSRGDLLSMQDQRVRVEADLADTTAQLAEIQASIRNLKEQHEQAVTSFLSEQSKGIQAAERQVEQLDQEIRKQQDRLGHLGLKAPIAGTVQQLAITSVGQVVNPGQPLLIIIPDQSDLIVEALVASQNIGFVAEGDSVVVKADAFPFTRYGAFEGRVEKISDDAVTVRDAQGLQDVTATVTGQATPTANGVPDVNGLFYIARIRLKSTELHWNGRLLKLEAGMTVRAEIKTESRRVIDYVLSPVKEVLAETGHEK